MYIYFQQYTSFFFLFFFLLLYDFIDQLVLTITIYFSQKV